MLDKLKFWKKRKCHICGYPNSEHFKVVEGLFGKPKTIYCCNLCYNLRYKNKPYTQHHEDEMS